MKKNKSKNYLRKKIYSAEFRYFADFPWSHAWEVDAEEQHGINFLTWLCHQVGGCDTSETPRLNRRQMNKVGEAWARSRGWGYDCLSFYQKEKASIESQIINYLRNSDFLSPSANCGKSKNLSQRDVVTLEKTQKRVYLWGNCIFTLDKENNVKFSFQGWQDPTTKRRVNALLMTFSSCSIIEENGELIFINSRDEIFPIGVDFIYTIRNGKPLEVESI